MVYNLNLKKYQFNDHNCKKYISHKQKLKNDDKVTKNKNNKKYTNNIYVLFLFTVIFLLVLWYIYKNVNYKNKKSNIKDFNSEPELVMLNPKFQNYTKLYQ